MTDAEHRARIDALLADMSPSEKAGQLTQYFYFAGLPGAPDDEMSPAEQGAMVEQALARGTVGALLFVCDPAEINRLQRLAVEGNRHGIPALFAYDLIHGLRTIFPVPIALAATWNPDLIEAAQRVVAREGRAVGLHWAFAPMVDIARDPRWGRLVEGAGEDPVLGAAVAAAQVRGLQGGPDDLGEGDRVIAGPKHFAGYGFALGGRDYDEVDVSDQQLHNIVLPPFRAAVAAGAANVMLAYMAVNGIPATGNRPLVQERLRGELGFDGFVVSDANAVRNLVTHGLAADPADAAARALTAGCDMEMATADPAYDHLPAALEQGLVDPDVLDTAVRRVLEVKLRLGLFDDPYVDEPRAAQVLADPAHRVAAQQAAEQSVVLLHNRQQTLPLAADRLGRVAVIGPLADSRRDILGPWSFDFDLDETSTVLDGLRRRLPDSDVAFAAGVGPAVRPTRSIFDTHGNNRPSEPVGFDDEAELAAAVELARRSDVAVVVVGEWQHMVGEQASRASLDLPGDQRRLVELVADTGTPTIMVLLAARPLSVGWALERTAAVVHTWYPGTRGGDALARLLCGDAVPGGKLPFTWPRSVGQVPLIYSHLTSHEPENQDSRYWDEPSVPLWPFGFGLSYTSFAITAPRVDRDRIGPGEIATATVTVTNTGPVAGAEVVQLYTHQRHGAAARPVRELKGFQRVQLDPGASVDVAFPVGHDQLAYWNAASRSWQLDATVVDIAVGNDSTAPFTTALTVDAGATR